MTRLSAVLLAAWLMGCTTAPQEASEPPLPPAKAATAAEERATVDGTIAGLRAGLKDSDSAQFQTSFVTATTGRDGRQHLAVCGQIKAKNSFGAYNGWHTFIADEGREPGPYDVLIANADANDPLAGIPDAACTRDHGTWGTKDYSAEIQKAVQAH